MGKYWVWNVQILITFFYRVMTIINFFEKDRFQLWSLHKSHTSEVSLLSDIVTIFYSFHLFDLV